MCRRSICQSVNTSQRPDDCRRSISQSVNTSQSGPADWLMCRGSVYQSVNTSQSGLGRRLMYRRSICQSVNTTQSGPVDRLTCARLGKSDPLPSPSVPSMISDINTRPLGGGGSSTHLHKIEIWKVVKKSGYMSGSCTRAVPVNYFQVISLVLDVQ